MNRKSSPAGWPVMGMAIFTTVFIVAAATSTAIAQSSQQQQQQTTPLETRNVSGYLRDSLNKPIMGATVSLYSEKDTMQTATNNFGYYGFERVRSADFLLTINALGHDPFNRRYFNNDTREQLTIPPIRLGVKVEALEEVTIQGLRGPVVKGDTTEFWARDYIVRDYARLEDLLRRMEGITIDPDGSVFYNGEPVVRALFNNETYFSGSVQEAMKELPANIVERVQIIDRNVDGLGERNMKSDETAKVMNIVTKEDRSSGRMYGISAEQGTQSRTKATGSVRRIDGQDQLTLRAGYAQVPEGIKSDPVPGSIAQNMAGTLSIMSYGNIVVHQMAGMGGGPGVSDGRQRETTAGFGHNLRVGGLHIYPEYDFKYTDRWTGTSTLSEQFYEEGSIRSVAEQRNEQQEQNHRVNANFTSFSQDRGRMFHGGLSADYRQYDNYSGSTSDRSGLINSLEQQWSDRKGDRLNINLRANYSAKMGEKWQWNLMASSSYSGDQGDEENRTDVFAQQSGSPDPLPATPDSTVHQLRNTNNNSLTNAVQNTFTWDLSERFKVRTGLGANQTLSVRDIRARLYDGTAFVGQPDLSNYQRISNLSIPLTVNAEYKFSSGIFISPGIDMRNSRIAGKLNPGTPSIGRFDMLWGTRSAVGYSGERYGNLSLSFSTNYQQPGIAQLNPDPYYVTPYDVQEGNPDLDNAFSRRVDFRYAYDIRKWRLSVGLMSNLALTDRIVVSDRYTEIDPEAEIIKTITRYLNVDGGRQQSHRIDLTQTLRKLNSTIKYAGSVNRSVHPYFMNGKPETRNALSQTHSLSFFYSPVHWFEVTPDLRYQASEDHNSLATFAAKTYNRVFYADLKSSFYLPKDFRINANLSQSVHRTTNILTETSPFVVNANIEKRIFPKKDGIISFVVMDLAQQNAFTNYHSNEQGYTNTLTNPDSRYFMLQFSWQPHFWGRSKHDAGKGRRGDGSFIN